jgi:hypothetical protein
MGLKSASKSSIFGGGDGLQQHEAAILTALLAYAFSADLEIGLYATGWTCVILGFWLLFDGKHEDPLLLVDTAHSFLCMYTFGGASGMSDHSIMLLHITYHVVLVTLCAALLSPAKWFAGLTPCLYTFASFMAFFADRAIRSLDPTMMLTATQLTLHCADFYAMPWHWGVYNLLGGSDPKGGRVHALPFGLYTAYGSFKIMYMYPALLLPPRLDALQDVPLSAASGSVRGIYTAVLLANCVILYFVVIPRVLAALRHARAVVGHLLG